jgi:hypothetical protein
MVEETEEGSARAAAAASVWREINRGCLYMLEARTSIASALSLFMRLFSSRAVSMRDSNTVEGERDTQCVYERERERERERESERERRSISKDGRQ